VPVLRRWLDRAPDGWRVLGASVVVNAISDGAWFYGFSVFLLPISRDLALSRAATSLPFAIKGIIVAVLGPPTGIWIDRAGPSQILRLSAVLAGIGYVLLSWVHGYGMFLGAIALITIGMLGFVPSTTAAVTRSARRRRSLAVSVAHMGFTMGAAIIPPLLAFGVATAGWRMTVRLVGVGLWCIVVPMARHLRGAPSAMSPESESVTASGSGVNAAGRSEPRRAPVESEGEVTTALESPAFWLMSVSLGLQGMVGTATSLHMVAIMTWKGLPESTAGYLIGFSALAMTPMILGTGWLGDRFDKGKLAAIASLARAMAWIIVGLWPSFDVPQMMLVLLLLAPGESIWALTFALQADLFGTRHYATLRGISNTVTSIMGFATPWLAGWIYDTTSSYAWLVIPSGMATAVAGLIMWYLPSRRMA
jgi:MFS transporter, OFA family, oxalate/formate antiporter